MAEKVSTVSYDLFRLNKKNNKDNLVYFLFRNLEGLREKFIIRIIFCLLFLLTAPVLPGFGQEDTTHTRHFRPESLKDSFALFDSDKLLEVSIRFDLKSFLRKNPKGQSLAGVMTFHLNESDSINRKVHIKNRGIFRLHNCSFSPMEINFKKPMHAYSDSGTIKKLKLVTHCNTGKNYDDYVLREYLVYKLFNILTDTSFRVRLLMVNYIDTRKNRKPITQYGFFIEPKELVAERTNSIIIKVAGVTQKNIHPDVMDRLAIFNYMVGNYDWSLPGQHNVLVMQSSKYNTSGLGIAIPYDFDWSGVVNAPYAIPTEETGLKSTRDRIFLGICRNKEVFQADLKKFLNKKTELYNLINEFPYFNPASKKDIINFLAEFFVQIEKQDSLDKLISIFINSCKKL